MACDSHDYFYFYSMKTLNQTCALTNNITNSLSLFYNFRYMLAIIFLPLRVVPLPLLGMRHPKTPGGTG